LKQSEAWDIDLKKKMKINLNWKLAFVFWLVMSLILVITYIYINHDIKHYISIRYSGNVEKHVLEEIATAKERKALGVSLLMTLLLTPAIGFVVSRLVSRRITDMTKAVGAITGDHSPVRVIARSDDEIGGLAKALNHVSDEMRVSIGKNVSGEAKLEAILSSMFEGVIVTNRKGEIIIMNQSIRKLFFVDLAPEGKKPLEVIRNVAIQNTVDKIITGKEKLTTEEMTVNIPEEKVMKVNGAPVMRDGELEGAILVFHDITDLRSLEKVRKEFVANVSHELRTPISSIKGYAETLLEGAIDDRNNVRDFISIIYQDSSRLAKLIDDLLDLSKIESGRMKMIFLPVDLAGLINRAVGIVDKQAKEKSISIALNTADVLTRVSGDDTRLTQVMVNLLDNAIKYTPYGGSVTISVVAQDKFLQIDVRDTGIGIPEEDVPRVFERFYRVDKARSGEFSGTGLGLSIVKHIVQAHGGRVWVSSRVGYGSTFSFTLPKMGTHPNYSGSRARDPNGVHGP
jgi:two-component system phosphate regulon sensor histidine kinase PhoR